MELLIGSHTRFEGDAELDWVKMRVLSLKRLVGGREGLPHTQGVLAYMAGTYPGKSVDIHYHNNILTS